jgi:hypothetical protein
MLAVSYRPGTILGIERFNESLPVPPARTTLSLGALPTTIKPPIPKGPYRVLCPAKAMKSAPTEDASTSIRPSDCAVSSTLMAEYFLD